LGRTQFGIGDVLQGMGFVQVRIHKFSIGRQQARSKRCAVQSGFASTIWASEQNENGFQQWQSLWRQQSGSDTHAATLRRHDSGGLHHLTAVALHGLAHGLRQTARTFGGQKVRVQSVQRIGSHWGGLADIVERDGLARLRDRQARCLAIQPKFAHYSICPTTELRMLEAASRA
jgi:hypothetical protein